MAAAPSADPACSQRLQELGHRIRFAKIAGETDILPAFTEWLTDWPAWSAWNDRMDELAQSGQALSSIN